MLANVALFAPPGLLLAIVLGRPLLAAIVCVLASTCIELAQQRWLPTRVPSLADGEHNALGAALVDVRSTSEGIRHIDVSDG